MRGAQGQLALHVAALQGGRAQRVDQQRDEQRRRRQVEMRAHDGKAQAQQGGRKEDGTEIVDQQGQLLRGLLRLRIFGCGLRRRDARSQQHQQQEWQARQHFAPCLRHAMQGQIVICGRAARIAP
ncbi:hypothetical protein D3C72_2116970 [compost metagenome]